VYAISVPMDHQMAVSNVADRAAAYGVQGVVVDGNDVLAVYEAVAEAADRAYRGDGSTLVEAKTYRIVPHSSDDDDRSYRTREEVETWKRRDPIHRFQLELLDRGILNQTLIDDYEQRARAAVDEAQRAAESAPYPSESVLYEKVYAD